MTGPGNDRAWRILALVNLTSPSASASVESVLSVAECLRAEVTLLSVIDRDRFERGVRYRWPASASGAVAREVDIHRLALPGTAAETVSSYADRMNADLIAVPADYRLRRWLRQVPLAPSVAALTSRCVWTAPAHARLWTHGRPRIACLMRLDAADERLCRTAQAVVQRCGGDLLLVHAAHPGGDVPPSVAVHAMRRAARSLTVPWTPLVFETAADDPVAAAADEYSFGLIVARRAMYVKSTASSGDMVSVAHRLPCPLLSVPVSSVTASLPDASRSVALA